MTRDDYEPNVRKKAWVEALLTKRDKIEKAIGMPLGTMLGCGHWGCVFESTPPWVVKLSIDPTEGPIWSKIMGLVSEEQYGALGFPEIKSLHRITPDIPYGGRKKKVWAIVREGIEPVYKSTPANISLGGRKGEFTTSFLQRAAGNEADFDRCMSSLLNYKMLATAWHDLGLRPRRGAVFQEYRQDRARREYGTREEIEEKIQRVTDMGFSGSAFAPLGESLSMLASNGVYLRDVHMLNIGWHVTRDADDWDRIVIFDPGHTPTAGGKDIEEALVENPAGTFTLYHGSYSPFEKPTEFRDSRQGADYGPGFYMATDPREAAEYGYYVYAATVALKRPLDLLDDDPDVLKRLQRGFRVDDEYLQDDSNKLLAVLRLAGAAYSQSAIRKFLIRLGYDSIYVDRRLIEVSRTDAGSDYVSVLSPEQILSWKRVSIEEALVANGREAL
jgi:hypothetical protein